MPKIGDSVQNGFPAATDAELKTLLALNGHVSTRVSHPMAIPAPDPHSNRSKGSRQRSRRKTKKANSS